MNTFTELAAEAPDVVILREGQHVAQKRYTCDACLKAIERGDFYFRAFGIEEGKPRTWRQHDPFGACAVFDQT